MGLSLQPERRQTVGVPHNAVLQQGEVQPALIGRVPIGLVPLRRLRSIRLQAIDID